MVILWTITQCPRTQILTVKGEHLNLANTTAANQHLEKHIRFGLMPVCALPTGRIGTWLNVKTLFFVSRTLLLYISGTGWMSSQHKQEGPLKIFAEGHTPHWDWYLSHLLDWLNSEKIVRAFSPFLCKRKLHRGFYLCNAEGHSIEPFRLKSSTELHTHPSLSC